MKNIFNLVIVSLFAVGCCAHGGLRIEKTQIKYNAKELSSFIYDSSTFESSPISVDDYPWLYEINEREDLTILYFVNGGCSTCIGDYLSFLKIIERLKLKHKISVFGILDANESDLIEYYFELFNVDNNAINLTHIMLDASYPFGNTMPHRNVMILNKENLGKQVSFSNNSFIF